LRWIWAKFDRIRNEITIKWLGTGINLKDHGSCGRVSHNTTLMHVAGFEEAEAVCEFSVKIEIMLRILYN